MLLKHCSAYIDIYILNIYEDIDMYIFSESSVSEIQ